MSFDNKIQKIRDCIVDEIWKSWVLFENGTLITKENFKPGFSLRDFATQHLLSVVKQDIEQEELFIIRLDDSDDFLVQVGETYIYVYMGNYFGDLITDDPNTVLEARASLQADLENPELVHIDDKMAGHFIQFYRVNDHYGEFSNFARYPVNLDGKIWPTSEHYFQAQKFAGTEHEEKIRTAKNAWYAAKYGRELAPLPDDWDEVKLDVMYRVVLAKFTQHPDLRQLLMNTGDSILIEHTRQDAFWADGGDGSGENWLGKILMLVRGELNDTVM